MAAEPLHLHVLRQGDTMTMYFTDVRTVVRRSQLQVAEGLLIDIERRLAAIIHQANARVALRRTTETLGRPDTLADLDTEFQALGAQLFAQLFPEAIQERLLSADPGDLVLHLDDQLVQVPWELAFDGENFLLARFRIGRQVLADDRLRPGGFAVENPTRLKMLIIADPLENLEAASLEGDRLCELLDPYLDVKILGGEHVRKFELLQELNTYDLVHYAGHAVFDPVHPDRSGWVLHDGKVTANDLRRLQRPPLLVFANACQSGATAPWTYEGQAYGIGSAFLLAGTQNYIGTFCVIHDTHSATFAADFYRHFLQGESLGEALAAARHAARQEGAASGLLWASYMHYGDPTFHLPPAAPKKNEVDGEAAEKKTRGPSVSADDALSPPPPPFWRRPWVLAAGSVLVCLALFLSARQLLPLPGDEWTSRPLTLALLPCQPLANVHVESRLEKMLHGNDRIRLVEHATRHKILDELQFSRSTDVDQQRALHLGKLYAARLMGFCRFDLSGTISVRLGDTETGVIVAVEADNVAPPDDFDGTVQNITHSLLQQVHKKYPLQGRILDVAAEGPGLNLGEEHGVTPGLMLDVFGSCEALLGARPIGRLQVTEAIAPAASQAKVLRADIPLQRGMCAREVRTP